MTSERRHFHEELVVAHLVAGHILHAGNHSYNMGVGDMRRASPDVERDKLVDEHEMLWNQLNIEVRSIHALLFLSKMELKINPQLIERYGVVDRLLQRVHSNADKLVAKYPEHATDAVKENLRLSREVHKSIIEAVEKHGIDFDYVKRPGSGGEETKA